MRDMNAAARGPRPGRGPAGPRCCPRRTPWPRGPQLSRLAWAAQAPDLGQRRNTALNPKKKMERTHSSPLSIYSAPRGLPQDPGYASQSLNVTSLTTSAFDLPDRLIAKTSPALIAADEQHFAAIAGRLEQSVAEVSGRLEAERQAPGGIGQQALDRDLEIHRLSARLRLLRRFGLDLCLGRIVRAGDPEPVYIGRIGLTDQAGGRLLLDWRSPAAEPFFGATH